MILLAVIVVAAIAGILAYLTDKDTKNNVFTIGSVDIELWEKAGKDAQNNDLYWNNTLSTTTINGVEVTGVINIVPTQEIDKAPYIVNVGRNDAYVYLEVKIPVIQGKLEDDEELEPHDIELFELQNIDTANWTKLDVDRTEPGTENTKYNVYVYKYTGNGSNANNILGTTKETTPLFTSVKVANVAWTPADLSNIDLTQIVTVNAYAIQTNAPGATGDDVISVDRNPWVAEFEEKSPKTLLNVGGETINLNKLNATTVAEYYGKTVTTVDGKEYALYYVDYAGDFGEEGTIFLKAIQNAGSVNLSSVTPSGSEKSIEIMKALNPDWAKEENRGNVEFSNYQTNEKRASYLCDPAVTTWSGIQTKFKEKYGAENVNYVVGGPSTELFAKAINAAGNYEERGIATVDSRWFDKSSSTDDSKKSKYTYSGYLYSITGRDETSNSNYGYWTLTSAQQEIGDGKLTETQKKMLYSQTTQWLASQASGGDAYYVCIVNSSGYLLSNYSSSNAACPLVSLKSGVNLTE